MPEFKQQECVLPDQKLFNSKCRLPQIPDEVDSVSHGLEYGEVVNMEDVTGLDRVQFSDVSDLGRPALGPSRKVAKQVKFSEKFLIGPVDIDELPESKDLTIIPEMDLQELRLRNEN
jgi:hypothetical protein